MITYEEVSSIFRYEEGNLIRRISTSRNTKKGEVAGSINGNGYRQVKINLKTYKVHRIIWLLLNGKWPEGEIDHINRDKSDNRISNLRDVSRVENQRNAKLRVDSTSGVTGVHYHKKIDRWVPKMRINGKLIHLGCFKDKESAIKIRKEAEKKYGFSDTHGKKAREALGGKDDK